MFNLFKKKKVTTSKTKEEIQPKKTRLGLIRFSDNDGSFEDYYFRYQTLSDLVKITFQKAVPVKVWREDGWIYYTCISNYFKPISEGEEIPKYNLDLIYGDNDRIVDIVFREHIEK